MIGNFEYPLDTNIPIRWNIKYETSNDECYRNYVLLRQINPPIKLKKSIPLIMVNPGSFDNEASFGKDTTLRKIRLAFLNSGYEIEILNLFNICEVDLKELKRMNDSKRNNNNPIKDRLKNYHRGEKVIIQWGRLDKFAFARIRANEILNHIDNIGLKCIGLKSEKGFYYHPRYWNFINWRQTFKEDVISEL